MQYMCCTVDMTYIRCAKFPVSVLAAQSLLEKEPPAQ